MSSGASGSQGVADDDLEMELETVSEATAAKVETLTSSEGAVSNPSDEGDASVAKAAVREQLPQRGHVEEGEGRRGEPPEAPESPEEGGAVDGEAADGERERGQGDSGPGADEDEGTCKQAPNENENEAAAEVVDSGAARGEGQTPSTEYEVGGGGDSPAAKETPPAL